MRLKGRTPEGLGHAANNTLEHFQNHFWMPWVNRRVKMAVNYAEKYATIIDEE